MDKYGLSTYDATMLAGEPELEKIFYQLIEEGNKTKAAVNWVLNPIKNQLSESEMEELNVPASSISAMIALIDSGKITYGIAVQKIFPALVKAPSLNVLHYAQENDLLITGDTNEVDEWINNILEKHPQKVLEFKKGKKGLIGFFVGEAMKIAKGKADAKQITDKFNEKLKS
jgi:aspartyl-tRNA(Asn)/glutamyl-tRNA(Gln) amidotransferase subunit B